MNNIFNRIVKIPSSTPIGCAGPYTGKRFCEIRWLPKDGADCITNQKNDDPHPNCGFRTRGLTVSGLNYYRSWSRALSEMYSSIYDYNLDRYILGNGITADETTQSDVSKSYRAHFSPASFPDHSFWNGYTPPDIKVSCSFRK